MDPWGYTDPNDIWANDNSGNWQQHFEQYGSGSQFITGQDGKQYPNPNYDPGDGSDTPTGEVPEGRKGIYKDIDIDELPDWLKPHSMHDFLKELKGEYRGTKKAYNVDKEVEAYLNAANSGLAMSLQQGNNVASEVAARAYQSGVPGQTQTGAIAAQFALPALQGRVEAEAKAAGIKTSAAQAAAQARAALAGAISNARNQYASTLATFREQNISREQFQSDQNLDFIKFQQQLQFDRDTALKGTVNPGGRENLAAIISAITGAQKAAPLSLMGPEGGGITPADDYNVEYRKKLMERLLGILGPMSDSASPLAA